MNDRAAETPAPLAAAPLRVLVADDSRIVHRYLALTLAMIPGAVLAGRAFNTGDAVTKVRELHPDVLILDIEMPTGSGLEVLKALQDEDPRPLIFVLTLHASPVLASHCRALGADRFFDKENDLPLLLDLLTGLARQPRRHPLRIPSQSGRILLHPSDKTPTTPKSD